MTVKCVGQHRGKESIESDGPHRPREPVPPKGKQPGSVSLGDQVATQTLHVSAFREPSGDLPSFPNTTHLEIKTPPGDQDGNDSDPLRTRMGMTLTH